MSAPDNRLTRFDWFLIAAIVWILAGGFGWLLIGGGR